ncbi:MAG: hypothetical protein WAM14_26815 [Candidatus Nitrosopolaris sp.]
MNEELTLQIKSDVCANRFYDHMEKLKDAVSEYLDTRFGRWYYDIIYDKLIR